MIRTFCDCTQSMQRHWNNYCDSIPQDSAQAILISGVISGLAGFLLSDHPYAGPTSAVAGAVATAVDALTAPLWRLMADPGRETHTFGEFWTRHLVSRIVSLSITLALIGHLPLLEAGIVIETLATTIFVGSHYLNQRNTPINSVYCYGIVIAA